MSDFDERSGVVTCTTEWGRWWQTGDEVVIQVDLPVRTTAKQIKCIISHDSIAISVADNCILKGQLFAVVRKDECVWTLEDNGRLLMVVLAKSICGGDSLWPSILAPSVNNKEHQPSHNYCADPFTLDEMQKKLTLERFQREQPGFDFSNADITGNYQSGGPILPS